MSATLPIRTKLIEIASREIGVVEVPRNSNKGERVREYQRATDLEGTGWAYCAAFVCWCIREWLKDSAVRDALKLTIPQAEIWRPKTAAAFGFHEWAADKKLLVLDDNPSHVLHAADLLTLDVSHVGIIKSDWVRDGCAWVQSIDGNTSPQSSNNEGGGVYMRERRRRRDVVRKIIRILP